MGASGPQSATFEQVAERMERKARSARFLAFWFVGASVLAGTLIMFLFVGPGVVISQGTPSATASSGPEIPPSDFSASSSASSAFDAILGLGVLRIGVVLVAIFVIQILVSFARYYFRLAEHLSIASEVLRLSNGDPSLIKELSTVLVPTMDFGKLPASPVQKALEKSFDMMKELASKIPTK